MYLTVCASLLLSPKRAISETRTQARRTLVLAIGGPPRAGLDTLTKVGVRCVNDPEEKIE